MWGRVGEERDGQGRGSRKTHIEAAVELVQRLAEGRRAVVLAREVNEELGCGGGGREAGGGGESERE